MELLSPAKLNLRLLIKGIRPDGYHLLESYFVPISLYDKIKIEEGASGKDLITFEIGSKTRKINNNTVEKSLALFREITDLPYFKIHIEKIIPIGAGLGGGSSNAGVVLKFLREKYAPQLKLEELVSAAAHIGADIPFFISSTAAWVEGIGEILKPMALPEPLHFVVVKPPFSVSTKQAYSWYDAQRPLTQPVCSASSNSRPQLGLSFLDGFLQNDLESAVVVKRPEIEEVKKALLSAGSLGALMTGSGSAVFGIFKNEEGAKTAVVKLSQTLKRYSFFVTHSID